MVDVMPPIMLITEPARPIASIVKTDGLNES